MAFQDVDTSGKVVNTQAKVPSSTQEAFGKTEADRDDELARSVLEDDQDDSYEELQHSLPMDFDLSGGNEMLTSHKSEQLKPDRIDQLLGEEVETDRFTMVFNQPSPS